MHSESSRSSAIRRFRSLCGALALVPHLAYPQAEADPTTLSLEQLVNVEVYSASKFNQKAADAPASVTVVTREDIRTLGHRTLTDVLRSMRGVYTYYDRNYDYFGARGFARPGDYSSRVLLLLDGYRVNDNMYDSALIGTEGVIDIDLIERVEYVRGSGSSLYGSNAFFGVVNIVTRKVADMPAAEIAGSVGALGTRSGRATLARTLEGGAELVLSASGYRQHGGDLRFPEFDAPATNDGWARGVDYDRNNRLYGKLTVGDLDLAAGSVSRTKGVGHGFLGGDFNDPRNQGSDITSFADASYARALSERLDLGLRLSYGDYRFRGDELYAGTVNRSVVDGRWWTAEAKLSALVTARHRLIGGLEYQKNERQQQFTYDLDPYVVYLDDRRSSRRLGYYLQDEITWNTALTTTVGARRDHLTSGDAVTSPRLAGVWRASAATTLKAMYGTAFRAPNVYEAYAAGPGSSIANPALRPESIRSFDLVLEHYLDKDTRVAVNGYAHRIRNLISQVVEPSSGLLQFQNVDSLRARGTELELERVWSGGTRLRASAAFQASRDAADAALVNSPARIYKAALVLPLGIERLRLGGEWQYLSSRLAGAGEVGGYHVANVNLLRDGGRNGVDVQVGVYNLFDRRYADPVVVDPSVPGRDRMEQNGRTWRLKLVYRF